MNNVPIGNNNYIHEEDKYQYEDSEDTIPNQDTVSNIGFLAKKEKSVQRENILSTHMQSLKEKMGDYIDSSGGTIDDVDLLQPYDMNQEPVPEVNNLSSVSTNNYGSTKIVTATHGASCNMNTINDEDSVEKAKKQKEFTKLTGENFRKDEKIEYPLKPGQALRNFMEKLSDYEKGEILDYRKIWYLGLDANKVDGSPLKPNNYGYDDDKGDYNVEIKDHIGYRFEIIEPLGKGSFGQALRCYDHERKECIALKIIRNKKKFQHQAGVEVKILKHLRDRDQNDDNNIIKIKDYIIFRKHLCISFELLSIDLYEFIKNNNFRGVSLGLIRRFAIQILQALKFIKDEKIIHCDLKPENILLKNINKSGIKIIDFGSS